MKGVIIFLAVMSFQKPFSKPKTTEVTISIKQRIELLKREIMEEIQDKANMPRANQMSDQFSDNYEYVDLGNQPMTPIQEFDKRKEKDRYKLPEIISKPTEKWVPSDVSDDEKPLRSKKHHFKYSKVVHKPKDIFYRKMYLDDEERNKPQKWTHCLDLITPYLNGYKDNMTAKSVAANDDTVVRLAHLLSINTTDRGKDEIRSILYQISNLQIRFYQWDYNAIKLLFNVIIPSKVHDFKTLKYGLKAIFHTWQLDTSDISSFLKQSRIFRPPCIQVSEFEGSTLTSKSIRYTKPDKKKNCKESEDDECSA